MNTAGRQTHTSELRLNGRTTGRGLTIEIGEVVSLLDGELPLFLLRRLQQILGRQPHVLHRQPARRQQERQGQVASSLKRVRCRQRVELMLWSRYAHGCDGEALLGALELSRSDQLHEARFTMRNLATHAGTIAAMSYAPCAPFADRRGTQPAWCLQKQRIKADLAQAKANGGGVGHVPIGLVSLQ